MTELVNKIGTFEQDNLIARLFPPADTMGIVIGKLEAASTLKRGTLLAKGADGKYVPYTGPEDDTDEEIENKDENKEPEESKDAVSTEPGDDKKPSAILCDDTYVGTENDETAVAYRSGNFNPAAVEAASGYKMTDIDIDELRKYDIIFTQMI